jgi:hypothetical protein
MEGNELHWLVNISRTTLCYVPEKAIYIIFTVKTPNSHLSICFQLGAMLSKGLHWGFCIPSSCTPEDITVGLSEYLGNKHFVSVSVNNTDCHFDADKSFGAIDGASL